MVSFPRPERTTVAPHTTMPVLGLGVTPVSKVSKKKNVPRQRKPSVVRHRRKAIGKGRGILEMSLLVLFAGSILVFLALHLRG
jgi:hypothetical protein